MQPRRLERSTTNHVIAGVCGGLAEYFAIDATLVRVFFVVSGVLTAGLFILAYIAFLLFMPLPGQRPPIDGMVGTRTVSDAPIDPDAPRATFAPADDRPRNALGYILVALGLIFLLGNFGAFRFFQFQLVWPIVIIALGVLLLLQRTRS